MGRWVSPFTATLEAFTAPPLVSRALPLIQILSGGRPAGQSEFVLHEWVGVGQPRKDIGHRRRPARIVRDCRTSKRTPASARAFGSGVGVGTGHPLIWRTHLPHGSLRRNQAGYRLSRVWPGDARGTGGELDDCDVNRPSSRWRPPNSEIGASLIADASSKSGFGHVSFEKGRTFKSLRSPAERPALPPKATRARRPGSW